MKLADLVVDGDAGQPDGMRFYRSGEGRKTKVSSWKAPWPWSAESTMTVLHGRAASIQLSVTVHDVNSGAELMVQLDGVGSIEKEDAQRAAEAHAVLGNLDNAAAHFLRKKLADLSSKFADEGKSLAHVFLSENEGARESGPQPVSAQLMLSGAFRDIGVSLLSLKLAPKYRLGGQLAEAELKRVLCGPQKVLVRGQSEQVKVWFGFVLRLDPKNFTAAMRAVDDDVPLDETESRVWSALAGVYDGAAFETGSARLEAELIEKLNRELQPKYGRTVSFLRIDSDLRIKRTAIDPRRQLRHDMMYKIRGTGRDLPLSHEIGWSLPESELDQDSYIAGGQYEGFAKKVKIEMDQVTQIYLQEKTFADVIFDFYADQGNTQTQLGERVRERLDPIATKHGVKLEGTVTTTLGEIPEADLFKGGDMKVLPPPNEDYQLKDAGVGVRVSVTVPVLLDRKKDDDIKRRLADLLDSSATEGGDRGLLPFAYKIDREVRAAVARALAATGAKDFLQSSLCEREKPDLVNRIQNDVANVLVNKFGLKAAPEDVGVKPMPCAFIELSSGVLGKVREVLALCNPALYDRTGEFASSPTRQATIRVSYRVNGIGYHERAGRDIDPAQRQTIQTEFFHRYVQTISANRDVELVLQQVDRIVESVTQVYIDKLTYDVLQPDMVDDACVPHDLGWWIERRVVVETGIDINVPTDRIHISLAGERVATDEMRRLAESRSKLMIEDNKIKDEIAMYGADAELEARQKRVAERRAELEKEMSSQRDGLRASGEHRQLLIDDARRTTDSTFRAHNVPRLTGPSSVD